MGTSAASFAVGQLIEHQLFGYRGVIVDVDPDFSLSAEWYEEVARSRPPKDQPWYHVLVHDSDGVTYVAERNLVASDSIEPIHHPLVAAYFDKFADGRYRLAGVLN